MGRPLHKKFFGNRNTGSASTGSDDGIGGGAVASVTLNALGSYTTRPTITFAVPTLPTGVRATGTITSEVVSATTSNGTTGTGYVVGDLVTFDGIDGVTGYVTTVGSGVGEIQGIAFTQAGTSRGTFTTLPSDLTDVAVIGGEGTLGTVNIALRAKEVVITEPGSGYTSAPTPTFTQSVTATSVNMLVDSGAPGATSNQENAITMTGRVVAGATVALDVIKQTGARRYLVTDGTNTGVVELVGDAVDAAGEANIIATDSASGTYYVTKITAHRAVVVPGTGIQFPLVSGQPQSVPWVLDTAEENVSVKIPNA
jgi:hypothetical protein